MYVSLVPEEFARKPDVEEMIQRQADATINATVRFESTLTRFMIGLNFKRKLSNDDGDEQPARIEVRECATH